MGKRDVLSRVRIIAIWRLPDRGVLGAGCGGDDDGHGGGCVEKTLAAWLLPNCLWPIKSASNNHGSARCRDPVTTAGSESTLGCVYAWDGSIRSWPAALWRSCLGVAEEVRETAENWTTRRHQTVRDAVGRHGGPGSGVAVNPALLWVRLRRLGRGPDNDKPARIMGRRTRHHGGRTRAGQRRVSTHGSVVSRLPDAAEEAKPASQGQGTR